MKKDQNGPKAKKKKKKKMLYPYKYIYFLKYNVFSFIFAQNKIKRSNFPFSYLNILSR